MFLRSVLLSTLIGASLIAPAFAGECPADKMQRRRRQAGRRYGPKGVTDKVLAAHRPRQGEGRASTAT